MIPIDCESYHNHNIHQNNHNMIFLPSHVALLFVQLFANMMQKLQIQCFNEQNAVPKTEIGHTMGQCFSRIKKHFKNTIQDSSQSPNH